MPSLMVNDLPKATRLLFPSVVWGMPQTVRNVYLTFDDGPHPGITPEVLDILNEYGAKATFFCVGENVIKHPATYQRLLDEGHSTGNHTYNHLNGWKTPKAKYYHNISLAGQHVKSSLFRPPYGKLKYSQYQHLKKKYKIIMWDVLSGDFIKTQAKEKCLHKVVGNSKPGSIILFHDSLKTKEKVLYVLPKLLRHFKKNGFGMEAIKF